MPVCGGNEKFIGMVEWSVARRDFGDRGRVEGGTACVMIESLDGRAVGGLISV